MRQYLVDAWFLIALVLLIQAGGHWRENNWALGFIIGASNALGYLEARGKVP